MQSDRMHKLMQIADIGVDINLYMKVRGLLDSLTEDAPSTIRFDEALTTIHNVIERIKNA